MCTCKTFLLCIRNQRFKKKTNHHHLRNSLPLESVSSFMWHLSRSNTGLIIILWLNQQQVSICFTEWKNSTNCVFHGSLPTCSASSQVHFSAITLPGFHFLPLSLPSASRTTDSTLYPGQQLSNSALLTTTPSQVPGLSKPSFSLRNHNFSFNEKNSYFNAISSSNIVITSY